jgi:hypothetical protein
VPDRACRLWHPPSSQFAAATACPTVRSKIKACDVVVLSFLTLDLGPLKKKRGEVAGTPFGSGESPRNFKFARGSRVGLTGGPAGGLALGVGERQDGRRISGRVFRQGAHSDRSHLDEQFGSKLEVGHEARVLVLLEAAA